MIDSQCYICIIWRVTMVASSYYAPQKQPSIANLSQESPSTPKTTIKRKSSLRKSAVMKDLSMIKQQVCYSYYCWNSWVCFILAFSRKHVFLMKWDSGKCIIQPRLKKKRKRLVKMWYKTPPHLSYHLSYHLTYHLYLPLETFPQ